VRTLSKHESPIYSILFPDSEFLVAGDLRGNVYQWDVASGSIARSFDASVLHTYNSGEQGASFGGVRSLALSPDRKYLACAGLFNAASPMAATFDPLVLRFEWDSQKLLQSHIALDVKGSMWRCVFHPDGNLIGLCGGTSGKHVLFWKPDQDKDVHRFELPSMPRDFDLHPDGMRLATTHPDLYLRISVLEPQKDSANP
jgi:WD40 repeat protein